MTSHPIPRGFHTANPYLILKDAVVALEFYNKAFGAVELSRHTDDKGQLVNVEIRIGDSPIMISGRPEVATSEHQTLNDLPPVSVYLYLEDVDGLAQQAIAAGAKELYPLQDMDYGNREGGLVDPFGVVWWIASPIKPPEDVKGYVLQPGEGVSGDTALKASRLSTGGSFTLIESHTTGGAPPHVHSRDDEFFYVLEGKLTVQCGAETFEAGVGAFVALPRGIPHSWDVIGEKATLLMMTAPGGLDEFLAEYHGATSQEAKDEIAARYGITWIRGNKT